MRRVLCSFVGTLVVLGLLVLVGCASGATPTPTAAPAKPAATATTAPKPAAATPAATATAAAKPAAATPEAKPAAAVAGKTAPPANWKEEWDKVLAAAKKEGKVIVAGGPGQNRRNAALAFQKTYPDIKLEFTGIQGSDFAAKVTVERGGGQYLWDVLMGGGTTINSRLKPAGVLAPLKPALLLPEVLDDSKWLGGFEDNWADKEKMYNFQWLGYLNQNFRVNRDFVKESELSKLDQLLEPQWKGKISTLDPRLPGTSGTSVGWLLLAKGEQWLRKFFAQDLVIVKDARTQMEWLVRGRYSVAYGGVPTELLPFQKEGLGLNVKQLDPDDEASSRLTGGTGFVVLIDKAPNPNAAKVFVNWLLSKAGQEAYVKEVGDNSNRLDVTPGPPAQRPKPGVKYRRLEREDLYPNVNKGNAIAKDVIK